MTMHPAERPAVSNLPKLAYVAPAPPARAPMAPPSWIVQQDVVDDGRWLAPVVTQMESADPVARAKATGLRMLSWGAIWLGAGLIVFAILAIVGAKLPVAAAVGGLLWIVATAGTSYRVARLDHEVSAGGVERHRIDAGRHVQLARMQHDQELKRMALSAWLRSLERGDGRVD